MHRMYLEGLWPLEMPCAWRLCLPADTSLPVPQEVLMALKDMSLEGRWTRPHGQAASTFLILLVCTNHSLTRTHLEFSATFWCPGGIPSHSILLDKEGLSNLFSEWAAWRSPRRPRWGDEFGFQWGLHQFSSWVSEWVAAPPWVKFSHLKKEDNDPDFLRV